MSYPVGLFNGITLICPMVSLKYTGCDLLMCFCMYIDLQYTYSLRFLGISLRVLRLEVSVYNVYSYITN